MPIYFYPRRKLCFLSLCSPPAVGFPGSIPAPGFSLSLMCSASRTGQIWQLFHWKQNRSTAGSSHFQGHQRDVIYSFALGFCWQGWLLSLGHPESGKSGFFPFFRIISPHTSVAPVVIRRKLLFFPLFFFHEPVRRRKIWLE